MQLYLNIIRTQEIFHITTKISQKYFILLNIVISIILGIVDEVLNTGLFFQGIYTLIVALTIVKEIYVVLKSA